MINNNYQKLTGFVGHNLGFLRWWGSSPRANMLHQSNFWSSEKMKAWPYPWTVPGDIGYFCFSSKGSMKNSMATFSMLSSKDKSIPWFMTCNQLLLLVVGGRIWSSSNQLEVSFHDHDWTSRIIYIYLEKAPLFTGRRKFQQLRKELILASILEFGKIKNWNTISKRRIDQRKAWPFCCFSDKSIRNTRGFGLSKFLNIINVANRNGRNRCRSHFLTKKIRKGGEEAKLLLNLSEMLSI